MTTKTTFDISLKSKRRTLKELFDDFMKMSLLTGILVLILFIVLIIPIIIASFCVVVYEKIMGVKEDVPQKQEEGLLIKTPQLTIKAIDQTDNHFYIKLEELLGLSPLEIDEIEGVCLFETIPPFDVLENKLFTYSLFEFNNGIILQEVNVKNWTSKIVFFNLSNYETETIRELSCMYDLTFKKQGEDQLNITMRFPGEKYILEIKRNTQNG